MGPMTMSRSSGAGQTALQRGLGLLEDQAAATGWAWDAALSHRVDSLLVLIEGAGA
jgi:hypothetical protein